MHNVEMHLLQGLLITFIPLYAAVTLSNNIDKPDQDPFFLRVLRFSLFSKTNTFKFISK